MAIRLLGLILILITVPSFAGDRPARRMRTAVRLGYAAHELCDVVLSGAARPNSGDPSAVDADALPRQAIG